MLSETVCHIVYTVYKFSISNLNFVILFLINYKMFDKLREGHTHNLSKHVTKEIQRDTVFTIFLVAWTWSDQ